jgi:hypothetical protein
VTGSRAITSLDGLGSASMEKTEACTAVSKYVALLRGREKSNEDATTIRALAPSYLHLHDFIAFLPS